MRCILTALRIAFSVSGTVDPVAMQPGKSGTYAEKFRPASSIIIAYRMGISLNLKARLFEDTLESTGRQHSSTFAGPLALSFIQSGMTMIATTIFKFQPFAVIGTFYFLAETSVRPQLPAPLSMVHKVHPTGLYRKPRFDPGFAHHMKGARSAPYGVQAISMLSNQTVSVPPIPDEVLKRIRVLPDMKPLMLWLAG